MSGVDKAQLMRYIEIEKEVHALESQNTLKNYEVRRKAVDDVAQTVKDMEISLSQKSLQTKKEKADVDKMMKDKSIGEWFKSENEYNTELSKEQLFGITRQKEKADVDALRGSIKDTMKQAVYEQRLTKEQEEYLEARNQEEVTKQQLEGLRKQLKDLQARADELKVSADKQKCLYEERDALLSDIFGGEYGSETENRLEAQFDELMDRKQRVSVANYKWSSARVLLQHAVNQMCHATQKWKDLDRIPTNQMQIKYTGATETRNNLIAAIQNVQSTQRYLSTIEFPYCKPPEMDTLMRAANNIYTDMADCGRHKHALQCYDVTHRRASALLQWFDNVIQGTIQRDLKKVTEEARKVEKDLRAERIKLIRNKVKESGGDVKGLTDADQQEISEEDKDMKGIGITRPAPVGDDMGIPDAQTTQDEMTPPAPTPLPLCELAPMPGEADLFGDIDKLKEEYKTNTEEYMKTQDLNKARLQQGLHSKLAARRHRKH